MFIKPEQIVKTFGLMPGMIAVDFGCGAGHYPLLMSGLVGSTGLVYAVDIQKNLLESVKKQALAKGIKNIEIICADLEKPEFMPLKPGIANFVLVSNILFQVENKDALVKTAHGLLKAGGRVAVIDWNKEDNFKLGPKFEHKIFKEEVKEFFARNGFKVENEFPAGAHHYGIIFSKM